jgi:aminomethyltransferase
VGTGRRTPLHARHVALGAKMVPFAGWDMPVQYTSIADEHTAVRTRAGVFDVSHMGQLAIRWSWAHDYLQHRLTNDLDRIGPWEAQYTLLPNEDGGIVDDLIAYRMPKGYLLVVNAANVAADMAQLPEMTNVSDEWGMLAVQGPEALSLLGLEVERFHFRRDQVLGIDCIVAGTGYTGESGCELLCNADDVGALWDRVLERGIVPCGLGARDTLRLEMCYPLHGHELTPDRNPYEAGLGWAVKSSKNFVGVGPIRRVKRWAPKERLVAFVMDDKAIPRAGMAIEGGGSVTSGGYSPMLERGIGMAYVWGGLAHPGKELAIDVRGKLKRAHIVEKPIYRRGGELEPVPATATGEA